MELLELPRDILLVIFSQTIEELGLAESMKTRTVCKTFDTLIQYTFFGLSMFEYGEPSSEAALQPDVCMRGPMITRVVDEKFKAPNASQRPVVSQMEQMKALVKRELDFDDCSVFDEPLVLAASSSMHMRQVIRTLTPKKADELPPPLSDSALWQIALLAFASVGDTHHAGLALEHCSFKPQRTENFGHVLPAAARAGQTETFKFLVNTCESSAEQGELDQSQWRSYIGYALSEAAGSGSSEIVHFILTKLPQDKCRGHSYNSAVLSALKSSHHDIVLTLMRHHEELTDKSIWSNLVRLLSRQGNDDFLREILEFGRRYLEGNAALSGDVLQQACRFGRLSSVELVLGYVSVKTVEHWTGALYWAARCGKNDILAILLPTVPKDSTLMLVNTLAGAVKSSPQTITQVLEAFGSGAATDPDVGTVSFCSLFDHVVRDRQSSNGTQDPSQSGENEENDQAEGDQSERSTPARLRQDPILKTITSTCENGGITDFAQLVSRFADPLKEDISTYTTGKWCSTAAIRKCPGVLLYICHKVPPTPVIEYPNEKRSSASMQVFADFDWRVFSYVDRRPAPFIMPRLRNGAPR